MIKRSNLLVSLLGILVVASLLDCPAWAQTHTGTITGLITDSSGAVVPNAGVKILNVDTNMARDLKTDSAGLYVAPDLLPGRYSVAVAMAGFRSELKTGLVVSLGQTITLNFTLHPGAEKQSITVVAAAQQLLDKTTSTLGQVVTRQAVQDLPLNGRNFQDLVPLAVGTVPPPPGSNHFFINGSRGSGNAYLIDGVDVTSPSSDPVRILPNLEGIGEFNVTTDNYDAEYGRALGGIVNANIKSGTNTWHGSLFEFFRNDVLDARNFFDSTRFPYKFNQFGGSLGGPIVKNKLFVFGDYQGTRVRSTSTVFTNVPTTAEDHGDFSDLLPNTIIYDPLTFPRTPFPHNVIPPDRLDRASAQMFALMPPPNSTGPYNYIVPQGTSENYDGGDMRVDYNPTPLDRFSVVVLYNNTRVASQPILGQQLNGGLICCDTYVIGEDYSLSYTRILSPTMVNEFTAAWTRSIIGGGVAPGDQYEPNLGVPYLNISSSDRQLTGFPLFDPLGYSLLGASAGFPSTQNQNIPQFSDNLSWIRGPHSFKTGFSVSFRQYNMQQSLFPRGFYVFLPYATSSFPSPALTGGNSVASALLGYPYQVRRQIISPFGERIKEYGAYFQDNFKATKRLTLNLGVRWDLYKPPTEQFNRIGDFDPSTVTVVLANQDGRSASTLNTNYHNFSPHVGFSYQATADGKTVIRGGYTIGYLNLVTQAAGTVTDRLEENPPFILDRTAVNSPLGPVPLLGISVPTVSAGFALSPVDPKNLCCGVNLVYVPQSQTTPYEQQWNLDVQRALPGNLLLDVAYVGTRGVHLTGTSNFNQAPPGPTPAAGREPVSNQIGAIDALMNQVNSIYNGLQIKVEHRFSRGLYLLGSYTWSHSIDDGSVSTADANNPIASSAEPQNSFNLGAERGSSDFDLRHRAVISYIYKLPFGKGEKFLSTANPFSDVLFGGWQVNGITSIESGFPFTPRLANGSADINSGPGGIVRPDLVGNPYLSSGQTINHWFNVAAFAVPGQDGTQPYTFGNLGRNTLRGPGFVDFDFSLFKTFNVTERYKLQFRSELFNIFNHPNFGLPNPNVDQPQAAIITGAAAPRQIQFALKLLF